MPRPCYRPVTVRQGETPTRAVFRLRQPAPLALPIDLTGSSAHLTVRASAGAAVALLDLTSAPGGGLVIDAPNGRITVALVAGLTDAATTAAWAPGAYEYELQVTFSDGSRATTHYGTWAVVAADTRVP